MLSWSAVKWKVLNLGNLRPSRFIKHHVFADDQPRRTNEYQERTHAPPSRTSLHLATSTTRTNHLPGAFFLPHASVQYLATHSPIKHDASCVLFIAPLFPRTARVSVPQALSCFSVMARLSKISMIFAYASFLPTVLLLHLSNSGV
jgi:hypothetical protein